MSNAEVCACGHPAHDGFECGHIDITTKTYYSRDSAEPTPHADLKLNVDYRMEWEGTRCPCPTYAPAAVKAWAESRQR